MKKGEIVDLWTLGSGKSTLIRCINGLEDIDEGEIIVDDIDIHQVKNLLKLEVKLEWYFISTF